MRVATWNVNSLKARLDKVEGWLDRAQPDVLLLQETKLTDAEAPLLPFRARGYDLVHHGEGRWNGVAIASRVGAQDVVTNFGDGPVRNTGPGATGLNEEDFDPFDEARMVSAVCDGIRFVSLYARTGASGTSRSSTGRLGGLDAVPAGLRGPASAASRSVGAGDLKVHPPARAAGA